MRLTIKDKEIRDIFNKEYIKLAVLEDIEDELGIDLITLFKAFKEDIWIKFDNKIMFVPYDKKLLYFMKEIYVAIH